MNIMHALHQLLNQPTHAGGPVFPDNGPIQAPHNGSLMQGLHLGGRVQLQNTNNNTPMGEAVQNAGGGMVEGLAAPDAESGYMGSGNVGFPMSQIPHLRQLIHGGSPQGFPGAESFYTSPNMQQPMPPQLQGPDDPGFTPLQGSRNVPNIQSRSGRTPQINF